MPEDELYTEHAAALEAFIEPRLDWQAFFEEPDGTGEVPDEPQLHAAAGRVVGGEIDGEDQQSIVFPEGLDRAKRHLEAFENFSSSCDRMRKELDRTSSRRSAATGETGKASRRLSRKLVEEEGGP